MKRRLAWGSPWSSHRRWTSRRRSRRPPRSGGAVPSSLQGDIPVDIRIKIGSGFNWIIGSGSELGIRISIQTCQTGHHKRKAFETSRAWTYFTKKINCTFFANFVIQSWPERRSELGQKSQNSEKGLVQEPDSAKSWILIRIQWIRIQKTAF